MRTHALLPAILLTTLFVVVSLSAATPLHRGASQGFMVILIPVLLYSASLPLVIAWKGIRRKALAVIAVVGTTLIAGLSSFSLSFTGFLIARNRDMPEGTLKRMTALHAVGFPLLLTLAIVIFWGLSSRLARRAEESKSPHDQQPTI